MKRKKISNEQVEVQKEENWKTYLRLTEKHLDKSKERYEYAVKQFDTLMIALSTAALGFTSNYIKDDDATTLFWARVSQILFLICLISNLFSHLFSMFANKNGLAHDAKEFELDSYGEDNVTDYDKCKQLKLEKRSKVFNKIVRIFNILSFSALISGIVSFIYHTFTS